MMKMENPIACVVHVLDTGDSTDAKALDRNLRLGSTDIVVRLGHMCNGIQQMVGDVLARTKPDQIHALILHGHGSPGKQGVSAGRGNAVTSGDGSYLDARTIQRSDMATRFGLLTKHMRTDGLILLKGCNAAEGEGGASYWKRWLEQSNAQSTAPTGSSRWEPATSSEASIWRDPA
jgi:hypothetical protein